MRSYMLFPGVGHQYCAAPHEVQWLVMLQHGTARHSTAQHSTAQHSTAHHSTKSTLTIGHSKEWGKLLMSSLSCATLVSTDWPVNHAGSGLSSQAAERAQQQAS
ncbi:TPA: hypothetical protein ACH3X2_001914 [Trebouxia sp. C0005]